MKRSILYAVLTSTVALGCSDGGTASRQSDAAGLEDAGGPDAALPSVKVSNVGAGCTPGASDCEGSTSTCLTELGRGSIRLQLPDGYCSASCEASAECGAGGGCPIAEVRADPELAFIAAIIPLPSVCWDRCERSDPAACRSGYACRSMRDVVPRRVVESPIGPAFLNEPSFTTTYCMPPIEIDLVDGGLPLGGGLDGG